MSSFADDTIINGNPRIYIKYQNLKMNLYQVAWYKLSIFTKPIQLHIPTNN